MSPPNEMDPTVAFAELLSSLVELRSDPDSDDARDASIECIESLRDGIANGGPAPDVMKVIGDFLDV